MKTWVKTLSLIVAVTGCLTAHAQLATINVDLPPAPDSIIRVTAEAQGLPLMSRDAIPRGGTFWLYLPGTISAPLPCPMIISNYPIYAITGNQYIMDGTGGQVAPRRRPGGRLVTSEIIAGALEAQAQSVIDFIASTLDNQLRQAARALGFDVPTPGEGGGGGTNGVGGGGSSTFTINPDLLWLGNYRISNGWLYSDLHSGTNQFSPNQFSTNQVIAIQTRTNLMDTSWTIEKIIRPTLDQTNILSIALQKCDRPASFFRAMDWTGMDSDSDGIPDWWAWNYFGTINVTATNLDNYFRSFSGLVF